MPKILLFLAAVFALLWFLRGGLARRRPPVPPPMPAAPAAQPIVACAQCGVHLPAGEALPGRGGVFCSDAHRASFERTGRS